MIQPSTGCWIWAGGTSGGKDKTRGWGYGRFWNEGQTRAAHIVMYKQIHGRIPKGKEIDHTCSNRRCINPHHLEAVTHSVNQKRAHERRKK